MLRLPLVLLAASGCDLVFGLEVPVVPAICGPFGAPEQLVFASSLVRARDFSVDATGAHGMVTATRTNAEDITWTGPHAIEPDGSGTWIPDDVRDRPILNSLDGGHVVESGHVFGWIDGTSSLPSVLHEYEFSTVSGRWGQLPDLIDNDTTNNNRIGNAIHVPFGSTTSTIKYLVEIKLPRSAPGGRNTLVILRQLPGQAWEVTSQASPLNSIDEQLEISGAVMTGDLEVLVYAASARGAASRLYASRRNNNAFYPGAPVTIEGVRADAVLTEPWIDSDCRTLYFRWDDATWMSTSLDGSPSGP